MNTALKSNIYPIRPLDNKITKSRSKKEILLDKLSKAIRLKHYSKATERMYCAQGVLEQYGSFHRPPTDVLHSCGGKCEG